MHPSRSILRTVLPVVAGAALLVGCAPGPAPIGVIPSGSSPSASASPSAELAVASPVPSVEATPSDSVDPVESSQPEPDPSAEPTAEPTDDPASSQPANPSTKPVPPAPADCGTDIASYADEVPDTLHFGGAEIEFTTAAIGTRNGDHMADDAIPAGIGLSPNELAVRVDPGTHIILRGSGMSIIGLDVTSVAWSSVDFSGGLGSSGAPPVPVAWSFRAGGTISVTAPTEPGDYMVDFHPIWFTHCLKGDGSAYGRIKVNG